MLDAITREYILQNLRSVDRCFSSANKAYSTEAKVSYKEIVRKEYWAVILCLNSEGFLYLEVDYAGKKFSRAHLVPFRLDLTGTGTINSGIPTELFNKKIHSRLINRMYLIEDALVRIQSFIKASTASIATSSVYEVATTMSTLYLHKYLMFMKILKDKNLSDEVIQKFLEVNSLSPPPEPSWLEFGE